MPGHHHFNKFPQPIPSSSFSPGSHSSLRLMNNGVPNPTSNQNCNNRFQNNTMNRSAQQQQPQPIQPTNNSPPLITDTLTACLDVNGTYVCTSYSPRCYIIQKVTPTNLHVTTGMAPIGPPNNGSNGSRSPMVPEPSQQTMIQNKYSPAYQSARSSIDEKTHLLNHQHGDPSGSSKSSGNQNQCACSSASGMQGNINSTLGQGDSSSINSNQRNEAGYEVGTASSGGGGVDFKRESSPLESGNLLATTTTTTATCPTGPAPCPRSYTPTNTNTMRKIVIIRGIPENTSIDEIKALFNKDTNPSAPHCSHCEFAHNDSWYLTFDDEDDATRAHRYIREEIREFKGQPVMARIKSKPTTLLAQGVGVTPTAVVSSNGYHQPMPSVTFTINPSAPPFVPIISQSNANMGPPISSATINHLYHQPNHITTSASGAVTTIPPPIFAAIATAPQPNPYTTYTPNTTWVNNDPNNYNLNGHGHHHGQPHRQQYNSSSGRGGGGMGMDLNGRPRTRPTNRHMSTTNNYNRRYNPNPPPRPLENHQNNPPSSSNHHRYHPSNNNNNNHRPRNNVKSTTPTTQQPSTNTTNSLPRNSKFDLVTSESAFPPLVGNGGSSDSPTSTTDVVPNHKGDGFAVVGVEGRLSADVVKGIKASNVPKSSNTTSLSMQTNNATTPHNASNDENNQVTSTYVVSAASPPPPSSQSHNDHPCPNHQPSTSHASVTKKQFREVGVGSVDDYDYYEESFNARDEKKTKTRTLSSSSSSTCAYKNPANSKNTADKSTQMNPVVRSGKSNSSSPGVGTSPSGSNHNKNSAITSNNKSPPETKATVSPTAQSSTHNKVNRSASTPGNSPTGKVMKDTSTSTITSISTPTPDTPENCSKSTSPGVDVSMSKIKLSYADVARANKSQQ